MTFPMIHMYNGELRFEVHITLDLESVLCIQYCLAQVALIKHHWFIGRSHGGQELWERGYVLRFGSLAETEACHCSVF